MLIVASCVTTTLLSPQGQGQRQKIHDPRRIKSIHGQGDQMRGIVVIHTHWDLRPFRCFSEMHLLHFASRRACTQSCSMSTACTAEQYTHLYSAHIISHLQHSSYSSYNSICVTPSHWVQIDKIQELRATRADHMVQSCRTFTAAIWESAVLRPDASSL